MSITETKIANDIEAYLKEHENKQLLRFITCGSVDDGKSTLIGRLLHDSKMIFEDQLAAIKKDSKKTNTTDGEFDLSLLVDGLQSEREQGITIDVAYRYFTTDKRKFIIADTPGHDQAVLELGSLHSFLLSLSLRSQLSASSTSAFCCFRCKEIYPTAGEADAGRPA